MHSPERPIRIMTVPMAPKKPVASPRKNEIVDFVVNGSDVLLGKSATKAVRLAMTKSEWFASMSPEEQINVSQIAHSLLLDDLEELFELGEIVIPMDLSGYTLEQLVEFLELEQCNDILLKFGDLINDGKDWLPEGGEN